MTTMRLLFVLSTCWIVLQGASSATSAEETDEVVPILNQISQFNDDGSYAFGYESGDGSFRVEVKDVNGYIKGTYGYFDTDGRWQTAEYEAGKRAASRDVDLTPVIHSVLTPEQQRALDFEYSSVDEDEDGMPDNLVPSDQQQVQPATTSSEES